MVIDEFCAAETKIGLAELQPLAPLQGRFTPSLSGAGKASDREIMCQRNISRCGIPGNGNAANGLPTDSKPAKKRPDAQSDTTESKHPHGQAAQ